MSSEFAAIRSLVAVLLLSVSDVVALRGATRSRRTACASLIDHTTYFSVMVKVSRREFEVIPDTGSNSIIVPSCECFAQNLGCPRGDACIQKQSNNQPQIEEHFGSGTIVGFSQSERVILGDEGRESAQMGGVLLMTDRSQLHISGAFEGILGLGVPNAFGDVDGKAGLTEFLLDSQVDRFQICFGNSQAGSHSGNVVFNGKPAVGEKFVANIGQAHWTAAVSGIAIGDSTAKAVTCRPEDMLPDDEMPCAAIPDSGTTLILGPEEGIYALRRAICDGWPVCRRKARSLVSWESAIQSLLQRCDAIDFDKMPPLQLRLGEATVTLPPTAYVIQQSGNTCDLAFEEFDYRMPKTGSTWVLGQALFLQYQVIFDVRGNRIGFNDAPCNSCGANAEAPDALIRVPLAPRRPRLSVGIRRRPSFNTSLPL